MVRWPDMVLWGTSHRRAISPAGSDPGWAARRSRSACSRVGCPSEPKRSTAISLRLNWSIRAPIKLSGEKGSGLTTCHVDFDLSICLDLPTYTAEAPHGQAILVSGDSLSFSRNRPAGAGGGDQRLRIDLRFPDPLEMGDGVSGQDRRQDKLPVERLRSGLAAGKGRHRRFRRFRHAAT